MDISAAALRYFVVLADELHFGRAAERLQITSPSLSQQISRLERLAGRRLFDRSPRAVSLTPDGADLLPLAREAVRSHEAVVGWARAARSQQQSLRVGIEATGAGGLTSTILAAWVERSPGLTVQIVRLGFFDASDALLSGAVDVALTLAPAPTSAAVVSVPLLEEQRVLVVRDDHPLAGRDSIRIDETNDLPFVAPSRARGDLLASWLVDPRPDGSHPRVATVADDVEGLMELCAAGIGVNVATQSVATSFGRKGLVCVPIADLAPVEILLCHLRSPRHPATIGFARIAREVAALSRS